ncbi:MAG: (Fe-S)-binding protein, partial [Stenotrophobium sp.]
LAPQRPQEMRRMRFIGYWLTNRTARRTAGVLLWLYQRLGLQFLLRRTRLLGHGPLARLESLLPAVTLPWRLSARNPVRFDKLTANGKYQTETVRPEPVEGQSQQQSKVALFTGCTGELADRQTLEDAIHVLNRIGVSVEVPQAQGCCGALHQHAGLNAEARKLLANNLRAFDDDGMPILSPASGCGATLMEYPQIAGVEFRASTVAFAGRVQDLNAFLLAHWPANLALKPLHARVLVHTPCTLRNVMKKAGAVTSLLKKIPGVEIAELDKTGGCCGAAGSYFITQPQMADALLEKKLAAARDLAPDFIVSANIGCSLHLAAGLRRDGIKVPVLHPVSLLARQLA